MEKSTTTPSSVLVPTKQRSAIVPTGQRSRQTFASPDEQIAHLEARLAKAIEVFRTQETRYSQLSEAYEAERKERIKYEGDKEYWLKAYRQWRGTAEDLEDQLKKAGITPRIGYQWLKRGPQLSEALTTLLTLAHPDKWSQGQPATELAHEVTILINALRAHEETLS
jgi:hypothetical protein